MNGDLKIEGVVRRWGDSLAIEVPIVALEIAGFDLHQELMVIVEQGRITIQSSCIPECRLDDLLRGITLENRHEEIDFPRATGSEWSFHEGRF
jgi:antitoxin MazE